MCSEKGLLAIKFAVELLDKNAHRCEKEVDRALIKEYNKYMTEHGIVPAETRSWECLKGDFNRANKKKCNRNYTVRDDGTVCFKARPIIGWEHYHEVIIETIMSLDKSDRTANKIKKRVTDCYNIPNKALDKFCEMCVTNNNFNNHVGGGQIQPFASSFAFGSGGGAPMGHEAMVSWSMQQDKHWNVNYNNTTTNNDNRTTNNIDNRVTNNFVTDHEQKKQLETLIEGQRFQGAVLDRQTRMLETIQLQTEQRAAPPSALRDERHLAAQEAGRTLVFGDAKGTPPAKALNEHCVKKVSELQDFPLYRQFELAISNDLSTDNATRDDDLDGAYIKAIGESFNIATGIFHQTDGFILDPDIVAKEEAEMEETKVSAMAKQEEQKKRFSTDNDYPPSVKKSKIIPETGWIGTPIGASLAANDTRKCHACNCHVSRNKSVCPVCNTPAGAN